jgi:acyl-CoA dehydrogenase
VQAESLEVTVTDAPVLAQEDINMAGEARDSVAMAGQIQQIVLADDPFAQMALARTNLMAGTLQAVLDLGLQFAAEREQFGRSISKFQAIQHSLAVVAAEVAAAQLAADAGVDALGSDRFVAEVAASKARVGEAVGIVAEQVHQVHGAMGFTHEHRLHHFTRRLWAWRDEWGNEAYWQRVLGARLVALGADRVWNYIATRG